MVKMNTTLKHKKKNNVKKNSNKNKSNKNKKTTRQKKYYRKRKYSRKMKGGKVCIKSTGQCLTVVGKYGDASSANKPTTTIIDENKNVIPLTPLDSQIVDAGTGSGSGVIQTPDDVMNTENASVENVDELSAINLDLKNGIVDTEKPIQENGDILTSITPDSDIKVSENLDAEKTGLENVVVDQIDDKTTSLVDSSVVNVDEEIQENVGQGIQENVDQQIQENVDVTQDNIDLPLTPSPVVTTTETPSSSVSDNKWKSLSKSTQAITNKKRNFMNLVSEAQKELPAEVIPIDYNKNVKNETEIVKPVITTGTSSEGDVIVSAQPLPPPESLRETEIVQTSKPPPPKGPPPQPPITLAQGNNVSTDNNKYNTEIDSIGNNVFLYPGEDGSQKLSGSSESMDNQNTQRSDDSITNNKNNIKTFMNNWMENSEIPLENNSEIQVESKTERFPENNRKEVLKDILKKKVLRSRTSPDLRSEQTTGNNSLFNQQLVEQVRNQQKLNRESESSKTNNDDWDTQGGKTRRRRSIKKNKKNSKSKKQSKKMRKNKKTRK